MKRNVGQSNSITKRIAKKLGYNLKTSWLRPFREDTKNLISIADYAINYGLKNADNGAIFNIMFHSNEILFRASPYSQSEREVAYLTSSLNQLFSYLSQKCHVCSIDLSDLCAIYK